MINMFSPLGGSQGNAFSEIYFFFSKDPELLLCKSYKWMGKDWAKQKAAFNWLLGRSNWLFLAKRNRMNDVEG